MLTLERKTVNISDDEKVFVRVEQKDNENEVVRYQYDNHLGSACLELDEACLIISYEEYHPFGTTSYRSGRSETEVSLKRYKYCGKERDEETGLYYYGARYYAAWMGRFVSVDPLQHEQPWLSSYAYASNNPVSMIDLHGLKGVRPTTRTHPNRYIRPSRGGINNYARDLRGNRLLSTGVQNSTTTTYRRNNDLPYGLRTQVAEIPPKYISTYTTPFRNTIQTTNSSYARERIITLLGDAASIRMNQIEERINTSEGMKTTYTEGITFLDAQKQDQFNNLQNEYDIALQKIIAGITDESLNVEPRAYTSEWGKRFILDGMKVQKAKEILGESPKNILIQILKQDYQVEKTTTEQQKYIIPEIRAVER